VLVYIYILYINIAAERLSRSHYLVTQARAILLGKATAERLAPYQLASALALKPYT
jgi:hypothetical protein